MSKFNEEEKAAIAFVLDDAIRLGVTLGSWLQIDEPNRNYLHKASWAALEAIKPIFVEEIDDRIRRIRLQQSGFCQLCGQKRTSN